MGVKNIIGDLNINGDLNVTGTIMQNGAPISGGGEAGTFDFSGSNFTDVNTKLFSGNSDFVEEPATIILPSTVTSLSVNMFDGASGIFKMKLNSVPTVSNSSYIPTNTGTLTVAYYFDVSDDILVTDVVTKTNWSLVVNQMIFTTSGVASGTALQPYTTSSGVAITWYTDETFANTVLVSSGVDKEYYGKVLNPSATRAVYCVRTLNLVDASVDIVDGGGNHYGLNNRFIPVGATVTITPSNTDPNKDILLNFTVNGTSYKSVGTATITVNADVEITVAFSDVAIDPILENNSWSVIRSTCEAGMAANYWSLGDTKTDVGTDSYTRTFRVVDMSGLYGKHVVFEEVGVEGTDGTGALGVAWDADSVNDYVASDMNLIVLPGTISRYSSALQNTLTNTTVKVAENGNSSTIVDVANKLFLEAEKEIGLSNFSRTEEQNTLTTYAYYVAHSTNADRIKYKSSDGSSSGWVLRSPHSGDSSNVCIVSYNGNANYSIANNAYRFAPCFSF